ncbi:rap1 GTPase-GDP dissociation stimulator 1-like isoform X2 [Ostrea edulis]|uniref:rap1 GTPase-GDP dissociation stimulator 1-like isoform X2 n=1 Tax=Ostrea edulis TaxID=37623 RepID=UPI0020953D01|nr:rap1 GTPase-GDP dissociation stimulator 1-like isoform X2 [Ostrea edulis]
MSEETEDILNMVESLRVTSAAPEKCLDRILGFLLVEQNEDDLDRALETAVEKGMLGDLYDIITHTSDGALCKVIQILAELGKTESIREPCVIQGFIPILLQYLQSNDITMATQACRALGNICFENDFGRNAVDEHDGILLLLKLLREHVKTTEEGADRLRTIACGFLLNVTNTHDNLMQKAVDGGALDVLDEYIKYHLQDHGLCNMVLLTLGSFIDSEICRQKFLESSLLSTIVGLLDTQTGEVYQETVLDLLINLSEWDEVKDLLAENSLSNNLIKIIQVNQGKLDPDSQQLIKMASDLLILLLTGDKGAETMFANGEGPLFIESVKWLEEEDSRLQMSAVLAIGNFARNDNHCQRLVEEGIVEQLLEILKCHRDHEADMTLQHAILSALRNLAIPARNKPVLLMAGVLDTVLLLTSSETMAVVFKLLGVLRMLVDGQETAALQLGTDRGFVDRLVGWCDVDEHAGVQGEGTRLLASLVKNGRSVELMRNVIKCQGIPPLVVMVSSEHLVMQNEALVALTLICSSVLDEAALPLKQSELTETISSLLGNKSTLPEILCNTLTLTRTLCNAESLKEEIMTSGIVDIARQLSCHDEDRVREAANTFLAILDESTLER